jgi:hypothetical protein
VITRGIDAQFREQGHDLVAEPDQPRIAVAGLRRVLEED